MVTQNKLLRILQFKQITTLQKNIYREFNTLKLKDLHYYKICCIAHELIHSPTLLPEAINDILCLKNQIHDYDTRYKKFLHPVKIQTKLYGEKTISDRGSALWNKLRKHLKETTSAPIFKSKLRKYILENYLI